VSSPGDRAVSARCRGDRGTSLIGTVGPVVIFLTFLLFSVQLLVGLYGRSVVTSVAYDGARRVAGHRSANRAAALVDAESRMRQALGTMQVHFDWSGSDDDTVMLRVRTDMPRFMLPGFAGPLATDHVDRTVTARVERAR